jgi:hypothetical protein
MNVGVMKDYKLRNLCTSHTLGWSWNWNTKRLLFIIRVKRELKRVYRNGSRYNGGDTFKKRKNRLEFVEIFQVFLLASLAVGQSAS